MYKQQKLINLDIIFPNVYHLALLTYEYIKMDVNNEYLTTEEGLKKLKEELKKREGEIRKKIADTLNEMRNQGDLSENDGYSMAVEEQNINEGKIREIRGKIQNAKVVKGKGKKVVNIGDTVTLKGEKKVSYTIVSEDEANPLEGKISHLSPLGNEIMGKKVGEKVLFPNGKDTYKIKEIS